MSKMNVQTLNVSEIQRFCMHDGTGLRTTVFLKGCPLRCAWCHNPETQSTAPELLYDPRKCIGCALCAQSCIHGACNPEMGSIDRARCLTCGACAEVCPTGARSVCGREMSIDEILNAVERDRVFYAETGGVTLSGGEPFAQAKQATSLLRACKERGLRTAVETCGYTDLDTLTEALPYVDLFLWDVKDTDEERHMRYTGRSNRPILANLEHLSKLGARIRLRCILMHGVNTDETHYRAVAELAKKIPNLDGVEPIAYHAYAGSKATLLGRADNGRAEWIPTDGELTRFREILQSEGVAMQ